MNDLPYVLCPATITSPAPTSGAERIGLTANLKCGERVPIHYVASGAWHCRCVRGHVFFALLADLVSAEAAKR